MSIKYAVVRDRDQRIMYFSKSEANNLGPGLFCIKVDEKKENSYFPSEDYYYDKATNSISTDIPLETRTV